MSVDVWPLLPGAPEGPPPDAEAEADGEEAEAEDWCVEAPVRPLDDRAVEGTVAVGLVVQVAPPEADDDRLGCLGSVVVVVLVVVVGPTTVVEVVVDVVVVVVGGSVVVVVVRTGAQDAVAAFDFLVVPVDRAAVVVAAVDRFEPVDPPPELEPLPLLEPLLELLVLANA